MASCFSLKLLPDSIKDGVHELENDLEPAPHLIRLQEEMTDHTFGGRRQLLRPVPQQPNVAQLRRGSLGIIISNRR